MLDPEAPDAQRDKIVADARGRIQSSGEVKQDTDWGVRKMAYEIKQRNEADYRFFRFQGQAELLNALDHELKIADGVLRFRIFKVDARLPVTVPPAPTPGSAPVGRPGRRDGDESVPAAAEPAGDASAAEAPEAPAPEAPVADAAEAPAEVASEPAAEAPEAPPASAPEPAPEATEEPVAEPAPAEPQPDAAPDGGEEGEPAA